MNAIECAASGRLMKDPVVRETKSGKLWAAVTLRIGDGDTAQFLQCAIFGEHAATVAGLKVHDLLYVEGAIALNSYTAQDGQQRHGLKATCFVARPLGQIGQKRAKARRDDAIAGDDQADSAAYPTRSRSSAKRDYARPSHLTAEPGAMGIAGHDTIPF